MPLGKADILPVAKNSVRVIDGPLRKMVLVHGPKSQVALLNKMWIDTDDEGVHIETGFDISSKKDFELGMRFEFHDAMLWNRSEQFYTDSNGFVVSSCCV